MRGSIIVTAAVVALGLAACSESADAPAAPPAPEHHANAPAPEPSPAVPLRSRERLATLTMPAAYTPKAPSYGTDDYRCFLLDPELTEQAYVTGVDVVPGDPEAVHHVILFQVPPDRVAAAEEQDASEPGQGWTCFGGSGLVGTVGDSLDQAPWIGAWAPGGGERVMADDIGIPLEPGTRVIMQVHYNLLAGERPDISSARLRLAPGGAGGKALKPLRTMLLLAPVELPCRPKHADQPLCERDAAVEDVAGRFGSQARLLVDGVQYFCGDGTGVPKPGPVQHCDRSVGEDAVVRAVAGHMHLLGRRITVELNPGTSDARTLLDVSPWNFDEQGSVPVDPPVRVSRGDTLRVTCRHSQHMRDVLPDLATQPERYVVWGEGTTDEMCLGIVLHTRN